MAVIQLTQGKEALVDDEDFDMLSASSWSYDSHNDCAVKGWDKKTRRNKTTYMHRLIMDCPPGMVVDHINHNRLDNRKANLRVCTQKQNQANMQKHRRNKSGYKGVSWDSRSKKWVARIRINDHYKWLGYFASALEAAQTYDATAIKYRGAYALTNGTEKQ